MAIVSGVTKRMPIPHEPDEWMELKRLSWRQKELAAEIQSDAMLKRLKQMGGDLVKALQAVGKKQEQDPVTKYDQGTVLKAGIVKWSYDAEINDENIEALDEETANWAMREILSMNKTEEEQKNA